MYFALPAANRKPGTVAAYPLADRHERSRRWPDAVLAAGARPGERGIELDGGGAHVVLPAGRPANLTELSVSVWVRLNSAVALPIGVWTHVEIRVAGTVQFLINGELGGENTTPSMGTLLLGATQFNYLGRSQNPKHPFLDGAVADFVLSGAAR